MKKIIVTAKGAALDCNDWKEGQVISAHENIANGFIKSGFAIEIGTEKTVSEVKVKAKK